jgi:hypothetical protein
MSTIHYRLTLNSEREKKGDSIDMYILFLSLQRRIILVMVLYLCGGFPLNAIAIELLVYNSHGPGDKTDRALTR